MLKAALLLLLFSLRITPERVQFAAFLGDCDSQKRAACALYAYTGLVLAWERAPTQVELMAITYRGELALYGEDNLIAWQALARGFHDVQSGYPSGLVRWLAGSQHWIDSVITRRGMVTVNVARLTRGYEAYIGMAAAALANDEWRDGQGVGVPSVFGNFAIAPGSTTFTHDGVFASVITHYHEGGGYTFNDDIGDGLIVCSLVSAITDTAHRFSVSMCEER